MSEMNSRAHVYITGRVQGVFFRATTREEARKLGVVGWVKNLPDGRVEAVFEGDKELVEAMIGFCHRGPSSAHVTGVKVDWQEYTGDFSSFDIRY